MLGDKKLEDLSDEQLIAVFQNCEAMLLARWEASAHFKFNNPQKKLEFPSHNPAFENLLNEIKLEIEKRKKTDNTNV